MFRLPNFSNLAIAILEARLQPIIGEGAIKEIKTPYRQKELEQKVSQIVRRAEERFISTYEDRDIVDILRLLPLSDLPIVQSAANKLLTNPTSSETQDEFIKQMSAVISPHYPAKKVAEAANQYLYLVWEELTEIPEVRESLLSLSAIRSQHGIEQINQHLSNIQLRLDELIAKPSTKQKKSDNRKGNYYANSATSDYPGLVVFLLDIGKHMAKDVYGEPATKFVNNILHLSMQELLGRTAKQGIVRAKYRIAFFAYASEIYDIYQGAKPIDRVLSEGLPILHGQAVESDIYKGFMYVNRFVKEYIKKQNATEIEHCPTPLICHITCGESRGRNPESLAKEIMSIQTPDGKVLIENVLVDHESTLLPPLNINYWKGIRNENELSTSYARQLYRMSSGLPASYRKVINSLGGFYLSGTSRMLFPGTQPEIIKLSFSMVGVSAVLHTNGRQDLQSYDD